LGSPHDAFDLGCAVLQREVQVTGSGAGEVREFSGNFDVLQAVIKLKHFPNVGGQFTHGPDTFVGPGGRI